MKHCPYSPYTNANVLDKYLQPRDWSEVLKKNHRTNTSHTLQTPSWQVFGEKAVILSPEVTEGPYCELS
jgi:hypothetical protein